MAKPKASKTAADLHADAVEARDKAQARLDKENEKVAAAAKRETAAAAKHTEAKADRDAVQAEVNEHQRLVDALAALVPGAPAPQAVAPEGVPSDEAVGQF